MKSSFHVINTFPVLQLMLTIISAVVHVKQCILYNKLDEFSLYQSKYKLSLLLQVKHGHRVAHSIKIHTWHAHCHAWFCFLSVIHFLS